MKVLVLHPPMYPVNYDFYNYLGEYVDLTIFQYGEYPNKHPEWTANNLCNLKKNFTLKVFGTDKESLKNQISCLKISELRSIKPNIVLSIAFWIPSFFYSVISKLFNFKLIILTNAIEATEIKNSSLRTMYRKIICINTTSFISASNLTTKYLNQLCSKNNIVLSIQTIELKKWREAFLALESKQKLQKKLKLPNNKTVILGVGNFYYKKNWIAAFKSVNKIKNILFVLIGSGEDKRKYLEYIKSHSLEQKIILVDRKEDDRLKEYFKASDMLLLPSIMETFGFVVAEALASNLPVLCSKYAGASTLIQNGYNGYIIDSKKDFSTDIKKAIENLNFLKQNTYKSIENLTLENRAKEFYDIFKKELL